MLHDSRSFTEKITEKILVFLTVYLFKIHWGYRQCIRSLDLMSLLVLNHTWIVNGRELLLDFNGIIDIMIK